VAIDVVEADDAHREIVEGARAILGASRPDLALTTIADVEALGARAGRVPPAVPAEGTDPLLSLVYTSGSTGTPKGAMFTERSWHARWSTLPFLELAALPMVSVVFLPQNHMGGRNAVANSLKLGGLACLTHGSDMSTLFQDIRLVRPTYIHLVPRLSEMIYQHFQSEVARRGGAGADAGGGEGAIAAEVMAEMRASFLGDRMLLALTASAPTRRRWRRSSGAASTSRSSTCSPGPSTARSSSTAG
jgi:fatty acid CoA ligase FadD9